MHPSVVGYLDTSPRPEWECLCDKNRLEKGGARGGYPNPCLPARRGWGCRDAPMPWRVPSSGHMKKGSLGLACVGNHFDSDLPM
eukprot:COSAG01_NODE_2199_length_8180_cov_7.460262_12_plen_84_part_00